MNIPSQPLRLWGWIILPALLALLATIVLATPMRLFGLRLPEPVWAAVLAFAWPVIRPSAVAPFALLLCGLFLDLFWGAALGQWTLALLAAYAAALAVRPLLIGQGALTLAAWYAGMCAVLFAAMHLLTGIDVGARVGAGPVAMQALVTLGLFPIANWLIESFEDAGARVR